MAKVLVAEDDLLLRWSLETTFRRDGHIVDSVNSGAAAIDAARRGEYRVVITDWPVPLPEELDLLRWVKTKAPQTHVIIISSETSAKVERLARDLGAFDFFEKPFQVLALKRALERALVTPERRKGPRA